MVSSFQEGPSRTNQPIRLISLLILLQARKVGTTFISAMFVDAAKGKDILILTAFVACEIWKYKLLLTQ